MTLSLAVAMQDIRDRLTNNFSQQCIEGGVPSAEELLRDGGEVAPHIVYNFSDLLPTAERGLPGARFDGYLQPVNIYSIASDVRTAQQLGLKVLDQFLGYQPPYAGQMRKRPGAGAFVLRSNNGAEEAFIVARSFVFTVEIVTTDVPGSSREAIDNGDGTTTVAGFVVDNGDGTSTI
jgi:hypothetical protein